jgi:hypothetical protein
MSFDQIWASLCRKKPTLENGTAVVTITSDALKTLLRQVYEQGKGSAKPASERAGFFDSIFGGGK